MKIKLKGYEIIITKYVATQKIKETRAAGGINTPYGQKQIELDVNAYGAELAFCKIVNVFPDLTTHFRIKGHDAFLWEYRIDVKHTKLRYGKLIARGTKTLKDADVYCLMIGELPKYDFIGWAYNYELIDDKNLNDLGNYGAPCYCLEQGRLRDPELLVK